MSEDRHTSKSQLTPLQRFLGSRLVTGVGMFLSKHVPPPVGYAIGGLIVEPINWLKPDVYWIVHANLRQVVGPQVDEETLHRLVRQVFRNTARNNYDLWHLVARGQKAIRAAIHFPPDTQAHLDQALGCGKGVIIGGAHTGNFDLGILALADQGLEVQVLGLAAPPAGGFDLMDQMRAHAGVRLTSISVPALREAINRLRAGGVVLTGVDRPVSDAEQGAEPSPLPGGGRREVKPSPLPGGSQREVKPSPLPGGGRRGVEFFGRPAPLPTGHVRLALKTGAVILVAGSYRDPQRGNVVRLSPPLEMIRTGDRDEDLRVNLRRVTAWLEEFIRAWPEQWAMFVPVWPEQHP